MDEDEIQAVDAESPTADALLDRIELERAELGQSSDAAPLEASADSDLQTASLSESDVQPDADDLPPDVEDITLETVEDGEPVLRQKKRRSRRLGTGGKRPGGKEAERAISIGDRGEEIALEAELERVEQFGGDAEQVTWVSKIDPLSDHDIKSVDPDGQHIYIEVKATVSTVPTVPCEISDAELRCAFAKGTRHRIFRVLGTETAHPRVLVYKDVASLWREGKAQLDLSAARLTLPMRRA